MVIDITKPPIGGTVDNMSVFTALGSLVSVGSKLVPLVKSVFSGGTAAATGVALGAGGAALVAGGRPKRRRRRKRLTDSEIAELMMLKSIVGQRSPAMTIAVMKMIGRG